MVLDKGCKVATVFLDNAKPFDIVRHDIMLIKGEAYGIKGPVISF